MAAALPSAISNANRGVTFVHTRFWTTLNFGKFDLIEHFHRMLVTAPAADLGRFTAIRFRSARLRQNWEFARHTSDEFLICSATPLVIKISPGLRIAEGVPLTWRFR